MNNFPIKATFIDEITYDLFSNNWSLDMWKKELTYMKKIGIDTVVFIRGFFNDKCLFPSKNFKGEITPLVDLPEFIFSECDKNNMKVYMGLYIKNVDWNHGDYKNEINQNQLFVEEVIERYGKHKSFYGWYIPHEVGTNILNITDIFRELSHFCKKADPNKKVLISPFYWFKDLHEKGEINSDIIYKEWDDIFSKSGNNIDYCAFQDGDPDFDTLVDYFSKLKKVCDKHKIELWGNVETFITTPGNFLSY